MLLLVEQLHQHGEAAVLLQRGLKVPGGVYEENISVPYGTIADANLDGDDNQAMSSPNEFVHNVINPRSIDGVE